MDLTPYTEKEQRIAELLVEAHNLFVDLERSHEMEIQEWVHDIHGLQQILIMRYFRRKFPQHFTN